MSIITDIFGELVGIVRDQLAGRRRLAEARVEAEIETIRTREAAVASWEQSWAAGAASSWKDEYLVLVISLPAILAFMPWTRDLVADGFAQLEAMPDYYVTLLFIAFGATFGVRGAFGLADGVRGRLPSPPRSLPSGADADAAARVAARTAAQIDTQALAPARVADDADDRDAAPPRRS